MYNLPKAGRRGMMVHEFCKKEGYCVKYIFQFARITAFCLAGEVLAAVLPLPIPASVYGLLLLAAALKFGVLKLDQVRETGLFLTGIFPLVPGAGIYYTAYYFIQNENTLALAKGISTFKIAVALAIGISLVLCVPIPKKRRK